MIVHPSTILPRRISEGRRVNILHDVGGIIGEDGTHLAAHIKTRKGNFYLMADGHLFGTWGDMTIDLPGGWKSECYHIFGGQVLQVMSRLWYYTYEMKHWL